MNDILSALQLSVESKNWYGALIIALTIPDICFKIENSELPTNKRYPAWFDKYKYEKYNDHLTGRDCYALRCSYLHEGSHIIEGQSIREDINKFSFSPKGIHLISFKGISVGSKEYGKNICHLAVKSFCEDMIRFAENWLADIQSIEEIQIKMNEMIIIKNKNVLYGGAFNLEVRP